ncbi:pyridoxal phosphate-dependent transferase [Stachybotrys elegans]|uniref:Pyridoxal phosphate-dependent transferase n=1 Tax=Stachybotrys elegans TaxID=80388 RepID=A0A8K0WX05_9HYPO|nr:pyridoxal phosphate-dependent transferase [Stachybotrys elegans]
MDAKMDPTDTEEFRAQAKAAIDEIADYLDNISSQRVVSAVEPGYLRPLLPSSAPLDPEPMSAIRADVQSKILPGITHWSHPGFMAFFPCSSSYPAAIAEMYSNAFNGAHFNWICSPAVTELETIVLDWLAQALGLPECFLSTGPTRGGGVIHGSASEAILTVMVAARDRYLERALAGLPEGSEEREDEMWRRRSRLVALGSSGTHSSTRKAAQIMGVRYATVPVSAADGYALTGEAVAAKVAELKGRGLEPFYLTATLGTTDVCAVDDFAGIARAVAEHGGSEDMWVHVDAAYAGTALLLPENQEALARPLAQACFQSFNVNPHKWMLTTFDCSAVWVRRRGDLARALSAQPAYLRNAHSDAALVTDYRDWQIPLGRRFRSLKLWFVMRAYGLAGLRAHVRRGVALAERLEARLRAQHEAFEMFTGARFGLLTFCVRPQEGGGGRDGEWWTRSVYDMVNAEGGYYLTSTVVEGTFAIRVCTGVERVREEHVDGLVEVLLAKVEELKRSG